MEFGTSHFRRQSSKEEWRHGFSQDLTEEVFGVFLELGEGHNVGARPERVIGLSLSRCSDMQHDSKY